MFRYGVVPPSWCPDPSHGSPQPANFRVWRLRPEEEQPGRALRATALCGECAAPIIAAIENALRHHDRQDVVDLGIDGIPVSVFQVEDHVSRLVAEFCGGAL